MFDENFIVWDGMIFYDIDYFFGIFSSVDGNLLELVCLYKNSFLVEYGGCIVSIVEMASLEGFLEQVIGSVIFFNLMLQGNIVVLFGDWMSFIGGGCMIYSNLGILSFFQAFSQQLDLFGREDELFFLDWLIRVQFVFWFYDVFVKWWWQVFEKIILEVNVFSSSDIYDYEYGFDFW